MLKAIKLIIAATALSTFAVPAFAQEAEPARTTYSVTLLTFADGGDERWDEIMTENIAPARAAAGMPAQQIHWFSGGEWDIMVLSEMSGGMASLDRHANANNEAMQNALIAQLGSEAAADALWDELDGLIASSVRSYTHTHP